MSDCSTSVCRLLLLAFAFNILILECYGQYEYRQQLGIYTQAPAAGYFNYGAPSLYVPRYKRSYSGGYGGYGGGYGGGYTSSAQINALPYGAGSTYNLYGSSGTNSYNPLPYSLSYAGGYGRYKRSPYRFQEPYQQLGIYTQAPAAGYFNYGAPSLYVPRYKRSYSYGSGNGGGGNYGSYGNNNNNMYGNPYYGAPQPYMGGYAGSSSAQLGALPYGAGSTNNLYGSSGTNSYNPLPAAVRVY